ncbi:MAG: hypothetical protein IM598_15815 [Chitinophagaceae bacterium]|nr:hypothetical protein [Chitinophagaceae bacterium]MCA6459761.1 hypothetical protein [Chitinophagaceae bacterium]MCA6466294.1 hypothetical protein [Chitinophagaceae bacterium]
MEEKTIEKVLNRISEERTLDSQELKVLKEVQQRQSQGMQENQKQISAIRLEMGNLKTGQEILLQRITDPIRQLEELGEKIDRNSELMKKTLTQKVVHEHHVPKLFYATVVLFCICLCFSFGWFQTGQRLNQYRNNDTKWRKLLLDARPALTIIMQGTATAVDNDPDKAREAVEKQEAHNRQVWELHQKMLADSAQMRALEGTNKKQN